MKIAVLGHTGFVGSNIVRQLNCECDCYNSKNIHELKNKKYDKIYCACLSGTKWLANSEPMNDLISIAKVIEIIDTIECEHFYLVSSQDCNSHYRSREEYTDIPPTIYGIHRLQFEWFIRFKFPKARIMRIGCLFGDGLKKNIIYDMINDRIKEPINDITYQLYCIDNLVSDFDFMDENDILIMNRFSEPVWVSDIANALEKKVSFNLMYAKYGNHGDYLLEKDEQIKLLKEWYDRYKLTVNK